jgi:hypothetical protein
VRQPGAGVRERNSASAARRSSSRARRRSYSASSGAPSTRRSSASANAAPQPAVSIHTSAQRCAPAYARVQRVQKRCASAHCAISLCARVRQQGARGAGGHGLTKANEPKQHPHSTSGSSTSMSVAGLLGPAIPAPASIGASDVAAPLGPATLAPASHGRSCAYAREERLERRQPLEGKEPGRADPAAARAAVRAGRRVRLPVCTRRPRDAVVGLRRRRRPEQRGCGRSGRGPQRQRAAHGVRRAQLEHRRAAQHERREYVRLAARRRQRGREQGHGSAAGERRAGACAVRVEQPDLRHPRGAQCVERGGEQLGRT